MSFKNRSIVTVHGGQCGVQVAPKVWSMLANEHNLNAEMGREMAGRESDNVHTVFHETSYSKFQPRAILFDLDASTIDAVQQTSYKKLFEGNTLVSGSESGANCYARARYAQGPEIIQICRDALRREIEASDTCIAVIHNCATSGGTGSGLMPDILTAEDSDKSYLSFGVEVYCSKNDNLPGYFNTVLHMNAISDSIDLNIMLDNEALYKIGENRYNPVDKLTFADINQEIAAVFSCLTVGDRQECENLNIRKFTSGLVPYVGLSYISTTVCLYDEPQDRMFPFMNLMAGAFGKMTSTSIDLKQGKYLGSYILSRGDMNRTIATYKQLHDICKRKKFAEWIPCRLSVAHTPCSLPLDMEPFSMNQRSLCHFYNHSAITQLFEDYGNWFGVGYSKKAFKHWYLNNGMQETEMEEALQSLSILKRVYNSVVSTKKN